MSSVPKQVQPAAVAVPMAVEAEPKRPVVAIVPSDPLVFASGGPGRYRIIRLAAGLLLMAAAWLLWAFVRHDIAGVIGWILAIAGGLLFAVSFWRRGQGFEVRREGIRLHDGGPVFGETTLVPWESITVFTGKPQRNGKICLVYRQQHISGDRTLPGPPRDPADYEALIDRLRFLLADRYPNLRLGGIA